MANPNNFVFGLYMSGAAEQAVDALVKAGFRRSDIVVLFPENEMTHRFAQQHGTLIPQGVDVGAPLEGSLGIADPGGGPVKGALPDALAEMGVPEDRKQACEDRVKEGAVLLSVRCKGPEDVPLAVRVLEQTGAEAVGSGQREKVAYRQSISAR
jgi:hypothetical protein